MIRVLMILTVLVLSQGEGEDDQDSVQTSRNYHHVDNSGDSGSGGGTNPPPNIDSSSHSVFGLSKGGMDKDYPDEGKLVKMGTDDDESDVNGPKQSHYPESFFNIQYIIVGIGAGFILIGVLLWMKQKSGK